MILRLPFTQTKKKKINGPFSTIEPIGICEEKDLNVILVPVVGF